MSPPKQPRLSPPRHRLGVTAGCTASSKAETGPCCSGEAGEGQGVSPGGHGDGATHSSCTAAGFCCVGKSGSNPAGTRDRGSSPGVGIGLLPPAKGPGQFGAGQGVPRQAGGNAPGSTGTRGMLACHRSGSRLSPGECSHGLLPITPQELPRLDPLASPSAKPSRHIPVPFQHPLHDPRPGGRLGTEQPRPSPASVGWEETESRGQSEASGCGDSVYRSRGRGSAPRPRSAVSRCLRAVSTGQCQCLGCPSPLLPLAGRGQQLQEGIPKGSQPASARPHRRAPRGAAVSRRGSPAWGGRPQPLPAPRPSATPSPVGARRVTLVQRRERGRARGGQRGDGRQPGQPAAAVQRHGPGRDRASERGSSSGKGPVAGDRGQVARDGKKSQVKRDNRREAIRGDKRGQEATRGGR